MRAIIFISLLLTTLSLSSQDKKTENPLANLPTKPNDAHLAKIKALGDNEWVILGQAAACDRFPRKKLARGRAWASKMAYAKKLSGAFFCGTGQHGATPEGYYMDDLWFYDANAHKWVCLYPGATKETQLKLDEHGFEVTLDGKQNPVSYLSHAYSNVTYVSHLNRYMIIHRPCPWWSKALPKRIKWLQIPDGAKISYNYGKLNRNTRHPIYWDVNKNSWERDFVKEPGGPEKSFCGVIEYIPSKNTVLSIYYGKTFLYDFANKKWNSTGAKKGPSGFDANSCYDSKRERVYVAQGNYFKCFDLKTNTWHDLKTEGQPSYLGNTNGTFLHYDSANDVLLWKGGHGPIFIYDPTSKTWSNMGNSRPNYPIKRAYLSYMGNHAFYNQELNAHFLYLAGDSGNTDSNWLAYRYKRVSSEKTSETKGKVPKPAARGQEVEGLQLSLLNIQTEFKKGSSWRLDYQLFNKGNKPVALDYRDGDSYLEIDGPSGPVWPPNRVEKDASKELGSEIERKFKNKKTKRDYLSVPNGNLATWGKRGLTFIHPRETGLLIVHPGKKVPGTEIKWPDFPAGKYKVRWVYLNKSTDDAATFKLKEKEWIGLIKSNTIEINVIE
ncbi:MAG: hypothetical protein COA79_15565 [Planctomycetota bacterium]|nr:MAG: hypothetical protein COA79_15565 [Planctomycetota bacterium]